MYFYTQDEYIPHLGDVILHQMFVEVVRDLQPADERGFAARR